MTQNEVREFIAWAKGLGAMQVKAGDYEVTFSPEWPQMPVPQDDKPDKKELEELLYGSA